MKPESTSPRATDSDSASSADNNLNSTAAALTTATAAQLSTLEQQAASQPKPVLAKRLIALMVFFTVISVSGLIAKQGVLFCILTLLMVLAVFGRQRSALYLLRLYTISQLALVSALPVLLYDPDNLIVGPTLVDLGLLQLKLPDWMIFSILISLALLQVWVSFDAKVKAWFKPRMNFNIMS
ncbi:hypothetical protein [Shewanella sp. SR44-3]|uniref:hypothetical protein n=1 Tax=Shewanella sp. SR44-3 TaxID=2760936 RepID=UPI002175D6BD|nr:hypothetical protein [Shewanella sp. SR44-3]